MYKWENKYTKMKKKEEYFTIYDENAKDMTDQSQICSASIVEMAKKFGIDAIIAKAEQRNIDNNKILDQLYGNDYTKMFTTTENMLNVKKKLNNLFENIPARIRKEMFNDNVTEFIQAYTSNDEKKLKTLNEIGLVSDTQLNQVINYNKTKIKEAKENELRKAFTEKMNTLEKGLYENFKETGNININFSKNDTTNSTSVQKDLQ